MKKIFKFFIRFFIIILVLTTGIFIFSYVSVYPSVWLTRMAFSQGKYTEHDDIELISSEVYVSKDYDYESISSKNQFNIISPIENQKRYPTVIWVHGGAFVSGDKSGNESYLKVLAHKGYTIINLNYQYAPKAKYPMPIIQVSEVYQHLEKNIDLYPMVDLNQIILGGDSAGAHIIAQFALIQTNPKYEALVNINKVMNKEQIKSILLYCGPYDFGLLKELLNPIGTSILGQIIPFLSRRIGAAYLGDMKWDKNEKWDVLTIKNYVTKDFPKTFITDAKDYSFEEQGKQLAKVLEEKGVLVTKVFYDANLAHEYQFNLGTKNEDGNNYALMTFNQVIKFLEE
ncbi:alpha/beta hydrolase [Acholeplasma palmae]|nr:alpha/beta hydrolase [Alteracholeplasma palmae]